MADTGSSIPAQLGKIHTQLDRLVRGLSRVETAVTDLQHGMDIVTEAVAGQAALPPTSQSVLQYPSSPSNAELPIGRAASVAVLPVTALNFGPVSEHLTVESLEDSPGNRRNNKAYRPKYSRAGAESHVGASWQATDLQQDLQNSPSTRSATMDMMWSGSGERVRPDLSDERSRHSITRMGRSPTTRRTSTEPREDDWFGSSRFRDQTTRERSHGRFSIDIKPREAIMEAVARESTSDAPIKVDQIEPNGRRRFIMKPTSTPRLFIDILSCFLLLYDSIVVPFMLAWDMVLQGFVLVFGWFALVFWAVDIIFTSVTGYIKDGKLVTSHKAIMRRYLRTGFLPDVVVLACEVVGLYLAALSEGNATSQMVVLRLARVAKISRAVRVVAKLRSGLLSRLDQMLVFGMVKFGLSQYVQLVQFIILALKLGIFILWLNHLGACTWYAVGRAFHTDSDAWVVMNSFDASGDYYTHRQSYLQGLYWSVVTMVSGGCPVRPEGTWEVIFAAIYIICSALFVTSITTFLTAMLIEAQMEKQEQTRKVRNLTKFLEQRKIVSILAMQIRDQFLERLCLQRSLAEVDVHLSLLSSDLRADLRHCLYKSHMFNNPFLRVCDVLAGSLPGSFLRSACFGASTQLICAHEEVFGTRTVMEQAYVIVQGRLQYNWSQTHLPRTMQADVGQWICEMSLLAHWRTMGSLEATDVCELLVLSHDYVFKLLQQFSEVLSFTRTFAAEICSLLNQDDDHSELNDLSTGVDPDLVLVSLPKEMRHDISTAILEKAKKRRHQSAEQQAELKEEVDAGRCTVCWMTTPQTTVERPESYAIMQEVHLRVCNGDGLFCIKLAELNRTGWTVSIHLPGKTLANQTAEEALEDLLYEDLGELQPHLRVVETEVYMSEAAHNNSLGVLTKHIQHVRRVELQSRIDTVIEALSHIIVEMDFGPEVGKQRSASASVGASRGQNTNGSLDDSVVASSDARMVVFSDEASTVAYNAEMIAHTAPHYPTRTSRGSGSDTGTRGSSSTSSFRVGSKGSRPHPHSGTMRDWKPRHAFTLKSEDSQGSPVFSVFAWITQSENDKILANIQNVEAAVQTWLHAREIIGNQHASPDSLRSEPIVPSIAVIDGAASSKTHPKGGALVHRARASSSISKSTAIDIFLGDEVPVQETTTSRIFATL